MLGNEKITFFGDGHDFLNSISKIIENNFIFKARILPLPHPIPIIDWNSLNYFTFFFLVIKNSEIFTVPPGSNIKQSCDKHKEPNKYTNKRRRQQKSL